MRRRSPRAAGGTSALRQRRSPRNAAGGTSALATLIASGERVIFLTGAGVSASCGLPVYRGSKNAVWATTTMSWSTRAKFKANPREWYDEFWLRRFPQAFDSFTPSEAHESIARLCARFPNVVVVTQNVDGLHSRTASASVPAAQLVEIHGRVSASRDPSADAAGYPLQCKCIEDESECPYASEKSFVATLPLVARAAQAEAEEPAAKRPKSSSSSASSAAASSASSAGALLAPADDAVPRCPHCNACCPPQILQFDEDYESHEFYQYETARQWLRSARGFVLVGTSHAVWITEKAVRQARKRSRPIFNFNLDSNHVLSRMEGVAVTNVLGKCEYTLVELERQCAGAAAAGAGVAGVGAVAVAHP